MTYKQLTKEIEKIDKQVQFMQTIQDCYYSISTDMESRKMISGIIDTLLSWKYYLKYDREYVAKGFYEFEQKNSEKYRTELEYAKKTISTLEAQLNTDASAKENEDEEND